MMKKDLIKIFFDEIYSKAPKRTYETNIIINNHIDETWSFDLADMIEFKTSNKKGIRYIFVIIDFFSFYLWAIPLKNKNSQILTDEFSNILTTSKRSSLKLESDRGENYYNSSFQKFLKSKIIHHYSPFTDKGPSIAERVIRIICNLLKKPVFLAGKASWINELPSVLKKYNNTIQHSIKMTTVQASKKANEKLVFVNLQD